MVYLGCGFQDTTIQKLHSPRAESKKLTRFRRLALVPKRDLKSDHNAGIDPKAFPDIKFLFWEKEEEVLPLVENIALARTKAKFCPSKEARDIGIQVFQTSQSTFCQKFRTRLWTCA